VDQIHTLLIKPGHPFDASFYRLRGYLQPRRCERIAQKVKAPADPADEGLVGVLHDVQFRQRLVDQPDRRPELPPGRGKDDPIIHEPGIRQPGLLHPLIQEFEVKRSHQRRERAAQ